MSKKTPKKKKFSQLWNADREDFQKAINRYSYANKAAMAVPAFFAIRSGLGNRKELALSGTFTALGYAKRRVEQQKGVQHFKSIITDSSTDAPTDVQQITQRLFDKAGLKKNPVVKVIDHTPGPDDMFTIGKSAGKSLPYMVGYCYDELHPNKKEALIIIGRKALNLLNEEELTAVLAHETAHVMVQFSGDKENALNETANSATDGMALTAMIAGNGAQAWPLIVGAWAQSFTHSKMSRIDEARADRNAMGLFPHPDAMKRAICKLENEMMDEMNINKGGLVDKFNRLTNHLQSHTRTEQRLEDLDMFYREAVNFYNKNGLAIDTDEILGRTPLPQQKKKGGQGRKPD